MTQAVLPPSAATVAPPATPTDAAQTPLLSTIAAAARLGLEPCTLEKMRCVGGGPAFIKLSPRAVRYAVADLEIWVASKRRRATSEYQNAA